MRNFKKLVLAGLTAALVSACANEAGTLHDTHTGMSAGTSKKYSVYDGFLTSIDAQSFIASQGTQTKQGVYISQLATGMGWSHYNSAYSFGTKLPYERGNNRVLGCSASGCSNIEEGVVLLTPDQFNRAAQSGLEMKLVGANRSKVIKVPAQAFQEAIAFRP